MDSVCGNNEGSASLASIGITGLLNHDGKIVVNKYKCLYNVENISPMCISSVSSS